MVKINWKKTKRMSILQRKKFGRIDSETRFYFFQSLAMISFKKLKRLKSILYLRKLKHCSIVTQHIQQNLGKTTTSE
jgi:hypothetical protein